MIFLMAKIEISALNFFNNFNACLQAILFFKKAKKAHVAEMLDLTAF